MHLAKKMVLGCSLFIVDRFAVDQSSFVRLICVFLSDVEVCGLGTVVFLGWWFSLPALFVFLMDFAGCM